MTMRSAWIGVGLAALLAACGTAPKLNYYTLSALQAPGGAALPPIEAAFPGVVKNGVLDRQARLVGEFAEIHLERMARLAEHPDVRAGAEDTLLARDDDHAPDLGMLEAQALHGVVQFDIHRQVVGIELELVARLQGVALVDVERQDCDRRIESQLPVVIARRLGAKIDHRLLLLGSFWAFSRGLSLEVATYRRSNASRRRRFVDCGAPYVAHFAN